MKAKLKARIVEFSKETDDGGIAINGPVKLKIVAPKGKVETSNIDAQFISLSGNMSLKAVIADKMKIGSVLTITISDEEPDEGLT